MIQHRAGHAGEVLFHAADAGAALTVLDVCHIHAADRNRTALGRVQPQQQLKHGALARTGAGKSTVFKLLLGLYPPESGTVTIGGVNVADIKDRERRTCISCVEQHFARVPGTVLDQITLGDPQITEEMAKNAAKLAGIDTAIAAMPGGYDTVCSEGMFSQGEWQLLSIARAAAADPAVLLLDEITANLDAETEARVLEALRRADGRN